MTNAQEPDPPSPRRFEVDTCLGRGGFGEVYRARMTTQGGIETDVALKILRADLDPRGQAVQRLRDEARLLARLNHPTILRVHDLAQLEGRIALITEHVDGQDLGDCWQDPEFSTRALLRVIGSVAGALDAAWQTLKIVHRDVKPSNIRVSRHGDVKLLDFGIARTDELVREARTQTDMMIGSPGYMAPERFLEDGIQPCSDIYALGVALYEGLAQRRLYDMPVPMMMGLALDRERYEAHLSAQLGHLPPDAGEVETLVREMLSYEAAERPTADTVLRRCEALALPSLGPSLSAWCRARTWPAPEGVSGALDGRTLHEGPRIKTVQPPYPAPPPTGVLSALPGTGGDRPDAGQVAPRPRWGAGALFMALIGGSGLALVGVGMLAVLLLPARTESEVRDIAETPQADAVVVPAPVIPSPASDVDPAPPDPEPPSTPAPSFPPAPSPEVVPVPEPPGVAVQVPAPSPRPVEEPVSTETPEAPSSQVRLTADSTGYARLSGSDGVRALPDAGVPPGRFTVETSVDGLHWVSALGPIEVLAEQPLTIHCNAAFSKCRIR